jgi:osmotically-inducible protein OsmY
MHERNRTERSSWPRAADDLRLRDEVGQALLASGRFKPGQLEVSASDRIVRLRGRVASYYQKQLAQATVLNMIGARRLVNDIDVT